MRTVAQVDEAEGEDEGYEEDGRDNYLVLLDLCLKLSDGICRLTLARSGSCSVSATGSCDGEDGGDGIGVLASFSNESVRFLCLLRVWGGDGGGLGGRCWFG